MSDGTKEHDRDADQTDLINVDGVADELANHTLAEKVLEIAREKGIELNDIGAIRQVLEGLSDDVEADPRLVFLLGMFVERILHHEEIAAVQEDDQEVPPDH